MHLHHPWHVSKKIFTLADTQRADYEEQECSALSNLAFNSNLPLRGLIGPTQIGARVISSLYDEQICNHYCDKLALANSGYDDSLDLEFTHLIDSGNLTEEENTFTSTLDTALVDPPAPR